MSLSSAVIDAMLSAGCTAEQLAAAVKAANSEADARAVRKREAAAVRKRLERARKAAKLAMSRNVTWTECDNEGQSVTPPPSKEIPHTPKETQPPPKERTPLRGVPKKGTRIPDDFEPDLNWAIAMGLSPAQAASEAAKFADYWHGKPGKDAVKLDWPATWRNWVRQALDRLPQARGQPPPLKTTLANGFGQLADELRQQREIRSGTGHSSVQSIVLDLPAIRRG